MTTYEIIRVLLELQILPTEKLVGVALAAHLNSKTKSIRVKQSTLAKECGLSVPSVKRAISGLIKSGVYESRRTGRAAIFVPCCVGNIPGIVERSPEIYQIAHGRSIRSLKRGRSPWKYDTELSTMAEEKQKRLEAQQL